MKLFLFNILILIIEIFSQKNTICRIPFGLFEIEDYHKENNTMFKIIRNTKYVNLSIGSPPQLTPLELDTNYPTFSISNKYYNKSESTTYKQISEKEEYFIYEASQDGFLAKDIINIDNKTKKEINFILGTNYVHKKYNDIGIIGLHIPIKVQSGVHHFFNSTKEAGLIKSYIWTLKFFNNISLFDQLTYQEDKDNIVGEFIFGDEPSNYENDIYNYNKKGYYKVNGLSTTDSIDWELSFSNIYITLKDSKNNSKIYFSGEKKAKIIINFSYILGPSDFFYLLKENYFSEYLRYNICQVKETDYIYTYIECEKNSSFNVESFPDISLDHAEFNTTFNLTYKDLFIFDKDSNKYIFLIIGKNYFINWIFGSVFLRKFQLVFDNEAKTIGIYKRIDNPYDNDDSDETDNKKIMMIVFIVILSALTAFLLIYFGMIIQKKCFNKNRKIRANELDENFNYESKNDENNENKLGINGDNEIIKDE